MYSVIQWTREQTNVNERMKRLESSELRRFCAEFLSLIPLICNINWHRQCSFRCFCCSQRTNESKRQTAVGGRQANNRSAGFARFESDPGLREFAFHHRAVDERKEQQPLRKLHRCHERRPDIPARTDAGEHERAEVEVAASGFRAELCQEQQEGGRIWTIFVGFSVEFLQFLDKTVTCTVLCIKRHFPLDVRMIFYSSSLSPDWFWPWMLY